MGANQSYEIISLNFPDAVVNAQGENFIWQEIYICDFKWLSILLLATTVMLAAAVTGLYFGLATQGPDVLGYFSTTLRDSPYIKSSLSDST
jgi:hypothetical protein